LVPTLVDIESNIDFYVNNGLEEILLTHPAIDLKLLFKIKDKINLNKLKILYKDIKKQNKLKPHSIELNRMCFKVFNTYLDD
jgi:hypothetical protein